GASVLDTVLAVYTGSAVTNLSVVASNHGGFVGSQLSFNAVSGTAYRIAVAGFNGTQGDFAVHWVQPTAPMFTLQPRKRDVLEGTNVTFTATAIGVPDPAYQWRFNAGDIS